MRPPVNRRHHNRHVLAPDSAARAEFGYPDPGGHPCTMPLQDMSASGLSIVLEHELPGLEAGSRLDGATVRIGTRAFRADLLVMHVTPGPWEGAVCGALVYPAEDGDLLTLREVIADLEAGSTVAPTGEGPS
jgi:hypothetical protein